MEDNEQKEKDKSIRLLNYLEELTRLRTKTVKDIDSYHKVLWLKDIPQNPKQCFVRAWGPADDIDSDIWIQIKKYDEPVLEDVPEACEDWVNNNRLYDTSSKPELYETIQVEIEEGNPEWAPEDPEEDKIRTVNRSLNLEDYENVKNEWAIYVSDKWTPWAELHKKWQSVQDVYSKLFSIHQDQLKLGEEYELVMSIGFLQWKAEKGYFVKRHLIVANANLDFDTKAGKFTVNPAVDGAKLSIEFDMLEPEDQPTYKIRKPIEENLLTACDNPWDKAVLDTVQKSIVNVLDKGQGEYHSNGLEIETIGNENKPIVNFSPALILRKRTAKSLQQVLQRIREQIQEGFEIPTEFIDLSEGKTKKDQAINEDEEENVIENPNTQPPITDQTIYFPLPSNDRQNEIISKSRSTSGVLVQGPPGTGKSHTIANLICHLLATGQRVLVTAKTPRALRVLKDKLPEEIQPLCINLLGSGIEEQKSLESSVVNILTNQDQWNENQAKKKIESGEEKIYQSKKDKSKLNFDIRSIRESESLEHSIVNNKYTGTAAKIALRVQNEKEMYGWFEDKIDSNEEFPFSVDDIFELKNNLKELTEDKKENLRLKLPILNVDYPDLDKFYTMIEDEKKLIEKTSTRDEILKTDIGQLLVRADNLIATQTIIKEILKLNAAVDSISKRPLDWIKVAVYDMLSDKDTPWKDLLKILENKLSGLKESSFEFENVKFDIPEKIDKRKLVGDSKELFDYFDNGGKQGFGIFAHKTIRKTNYIKKNIKIDGHVCIGKDFVGKLSRFLELQESVDYCWSLWKGKAERSGGPLFLQIGELEELKEALEGVVKLYDYLEDVKKSTLGIEGLGEVAWHDKEAIANLLNICQVYVSIFDLEKVQAGLDGFISKINVFKSNTFMVHPFTEELLKCLEERNMERYALILEKIKTFNEEVGIFKDINETLKSLSDKVPEFTKILIEKVDCSDFEKKIYQFNHAWDWSRAQSWLDSLLSKDNAESLEKRIKQIEDELNNQLGELASLKAWQFCFSRMEESHRRHLMGWQQAIKKIGKGTGKHAPKHRRDAQEHLNQCRDAVPAWVMPLHRVYETVNPRPGAFDVIIVDEASQCGPEGLPLTYLAKKLIVVGDDQQISPEAVGIKQDQVHSLMDEYLFDFAHADSFAPDSSLFDHGKRRFNNRIVLQEHFRCMPEIIRFSNDMCYSATPLIPLRQYPPDRLDPLVTMHVAEGFREGSSSNAINKPEAEAIVDKIVQCCNDEKYDDKTMGVIVLQGNSQAALIENLLLEQLGAEEIERRRLICGDAYSFQGDERNIIFLSMIADAEVRNVFNKASDLRRFNVAASRAQDQMWLVHTATMNDLSQHCLRRKLLEYFKDPKSQISKGLGDEAENLVKLAFSANRSIEKPPPPFDSWFELDVALKIASRGFRVIPQFPFAGKKIDLVIEGEKAKLAVECDGDYWHGIDEYDADMDRQRMLERCGWQFCRIRECSFNANPDSALENLWYELDKRCIKPLSDQYSENEKVGTDEQISSDLDSELEIVDSSNDLFLNDNSGNLRVTVKENVTFKKEEVKIRSIQEAMGLKASQIRDLITKVLKMRPNHSCVKDSVAGLILKDLNVISRGQPRKDFTKKVNQSLRYLERNGCVETYKSKNVRVRLK